MGTSRGGSDLQLVEEEMFLAGSAAARKGICQAMLQMRGIQSSDTPGEATIAPHSSFQTA